MFDLIGKTALITGSGQSVGTGIASALAAQGCTVFVNDIVTERAEQEGADIRSLGGLAAAAPFDYARFLDVHLLGVMHGMRCVHCATRTTVSVGRLGTPADFAAEPAEESVLYRYPYDICHHPLTELSTQGDRFRNTDVFTRPPVLGWTGRD